MVGMETVKKILPVTCNSHHRALIQQTARLTQEKNGHFKHATKRVIFVIEQLILHHNNTSIDNIKSVQTCIILFLIGQPWPPETSDKYCDSNNILLTEPNKIKCQYLCEWEENCVGISYSDREGFDDVCYVCLDDNLTSDTHGFNFYRRPGVH